MSCAFGKDEEKYRASVEIRWAQSAHVSNSSQATPKLTENIKAYPIINNSCIPDEGQYQKE